jgi:hypothetical protein
MSDHKDQQPNRVRPKRWLIDTNLWSSVADANLGSDLVKAARRKDIEILAAPSVLYELLLTPDEREKTLCERDYASTLETVDAGNVFRN